MAVLGKAGKQGRTKRSFEPEKRVTYSGLMEILRLVPVGVPTKVQDVRPKMKMGSYNYTRHAALLEKFGFISVDESSKHSIRRITNHGKDSSSKQQFLSMAIDYGLRFEDEIFMFFDGVDKSEVRVMLDNMIASGDLTTGTDDGFVCYYKPFPLDVVFNRIDVSKLENMAVDRRIIAPR